ncbi:hypothetical protein JW926_06810, partial [Candidatus Sumerlaeota bacterium]|nr:hypothetical protein [Candidatus Sumerlaeota bacterium]
LEDYMSNEQLHGGHFQSTRSARFYWRTRFPQISIHPDFLLRNFHGVYYRTLEGDLSFSI